MSSIASNTLFVGQESLYCTTNFHSHPCHSLATSLHWGLILSLFLVLGFLAPQAFAHTVVSGLHSPYHLSSITWHLAQGTPALWHALQQPWPSPNLSPPNSRIGLLRMQIQSLTLLFNILQRFPRAFGIKGLEDPSWISSALLLWPFSILYSCFSDVLGCTFPHSAPFAWDAFLHFTQQTFIQFSEAHSKITPSEVFSGFLVYFRGQWCAGASLYYLERANSKFSEPVVSTLQRT